MGRAEDRLDVGRITTVEDVWRKVSGERALPANTLMAINMQYADSTQRVCDGDEVAFFPPVTGG